MSSFSFYLVWNCVWNTRLLVFLSFILFPLNTYSVPTTYEINKLPHITHTSVFFIFQCLSSLSLNSPALCVLEIPPAHMIKLNMVLIRYWLITLRISSSTKYWLLNTPPNHHPGEDIDISVNYSLNMLRKVMFITVKGLTGYIFSFGVDFFWR